jgi:DNA-binding transcriptional LysR family regulator
MPFCYNLVGDIYFGIKGQALMELRHIRYFIRAAELLHFTHAAESLYISQPTLSIHIQQLEEELAAPLFIRTGRQVRLTEAGQIFLVHAQQSVRALELAWGGENRPKNYRREGNEGTSFCS